MYLLNKVPSKVVQKTFFELWTDRKSSLRHLHVYGCQTEIGIYNLQEKKRMQEQLVDILLVIQKNQKGIWFTVMLIV